ncbi:hypothetical protein L207DRAFT_536920 [Hyaloscypha variabilis F]|uniref:SWR1-complex protein 3 domain-containing protein n=1 Tax=Hyaloscypha variabilis (strain UAMH 11265 / GT02V1 / F) TaxID=1149755 RepID=A0A2J6QYT8_HYAVF|nr:hypothetical protein L207DRAFT_536920 [Hyaloscypha variabilis F]
MERKRKLPARAARVESVSKKRMSTPPEQRTQTPTPSAPSPLPEEVLPKSIAPGKALPTVNEPQPENLPSKEFQSISESGVLPDSLHRSRQKWLSEGIFEKYWTKPVKRKGAPEVPPNNPPKESMTKLGTCTITVEPHIFEASMFAIKDPTPRPAIPPAQPMYRPIIQYGPPGGMMPPPPPTPPPVQVKPVPPTQSSPQPTPRTQDVQMTNTSPTPGVNNAQTAGPVNGAAITQPPSVAQPTPALSAPPPTPAPAGKSTDPVIQMLAERAATDPDLKALMRIVANGEATPEELKKFQAHIDELTRIQKARQAAAQTPQPPTQPPPTSAAMPTPVNGHATARPAPSPTSTPTPARTTPGLPPPAARPEPQFQPQPQALRSKGPLPPTKPDISGVVFEFTGGSGDRFLFPKFSILEYLPGGQVIASFLIVRKGSSSDSPTYDPELDYYQPITIRLYAHQGRQLDALQKVVAPPDEVRRYMDEIMDKTTRAEYVLLAMRLPRDTEQAPVVEKDEEAEKADQVDTNPLWPTTHPTVIAKVKPVKKLITEEESHQAFINSVAAVIE